MNEQQILIRVVERCNNIVDIANKILPPYHRMIVELTRLLKPKCRVCPHEKGTTLYKYCKHKGKCHYKAARAALVAAVRANEQITLQMRADKIEGGTEK